MASLQSMQRVILTAYAYNIIDDIEFLLLYQMNASESDDSDSESENEEQRSKSDKFKNDESRSDFSAKRACLSDYTYDTLFLHGERSDITIHACGKDWHLHKLILCRSEYFSSMFGGAWKERDEKTITMDLTEDITHEALHIAFGSLYKDCVEELTSENVVPVLKAASYLQLDELIRVCVKIMKESVSPETVCEYFSSASTYGLEEVINSCLSEMELLLINSEKEICHILKHASIELMEQTFDTNRDGLVPTVPKVLVRDEHSLFETFLVFAYVKMHPDWDIPSTREDRRACLVDHFTFGSKFLTCEEGKPFIRLFKTLKLHKLVDECATPMKTLLDAVFPQDWLLKAYEKNWAHTIRIHRGLDHGPRIESTSEEKFTKNCVRCWVTVDADPPEYYRGYVPLWKQRLLGYNFGTKLKLHWEQEFNMATPDTFVDFVSVWIELVEYPPGCRPNQDETSILCRLQAVSIDDENNYQERCHLDICQINPNLENNEAYDESIALKLAVRNGSYTFDRFIVGVEVQFVNPLDHVEETQLSSQSKETASEEDVNVEDASGASEDEEGEGEQEGEEEEEEEEGGEEGEIDREGDRDHELAPVLMVPPFVPYNPVQRR